MKSQSEIFAKAFTAYKIVKGLYYEGNDEYTDFEGNKVWFGKDTGLFHEKDIPLGSLVGLTEFDAFAAGYLGGFEFFRMWLGIKPFYKKVVSKFSKRLKKAYEVGEIAREEGLSAAFDRMNNIKRFNYSKPD